MESSFSLGLQVLFLRHRGCISWFNFCTSWGISNLGHPTCVSVRVLGRPRVTLQFLFNKAPVIFKFCWHNPILHMGMMDLCCQTSDPLTLADWYWHAIGLLLSCLSGSFQARVIVIGQPRSLRGIAMD